LLTGCNKPILIRACHDTDNVLHSASQVEKQTVPLVV
jgi:hypothetical protein